MKQSLYLFAVLCIMLLEANIGVGQDFKTVGYFPTYRFGAVNQIELNRLTHLNIAFANPDMNGNLTTNGVAITSVVQKAHNAGLDVYIALAGGGIPLSTWENWITPSSRPGFISKIIDYVQNHSLQGVDVDLEWGTVNQDYSGFVLELKDSLDNYGLGLSAALPGTYRYPEISNDALAAFDWVNLMVYDSTGSWAPNNPGPHSSYSFAGNAISYWEGQGLAKDKMTLGVPFYGYDFTNSNNVTSVTFSQMVGLDPAYAQLDQVGQIYYNGLPTITQKTILALNEVSGVMIWEIGQDDFGEFSLLKRINETILEFNPTSISGLDKLAGSILYPNPTQDWVKIKTHSPQNLHVSVLSLFGKTLKTETFRYQDEVSVDLTNLSAGVYFVSVKSETSIKTFKVRKL